MGASSTGYGNAPSHALPVAPVEMLAQNLLPKLSQDTETNALPAGRAGTEQFRISQLFDLSGGLLNRLPGGIRAEKLRGTHPIGEHPLLQSVGDLY